MWFRLFCVFALVGFLAPAASARDIFVNNRAGDDAYDGRSPSGAERSGGPCRTIRRALELADKGDRIVVAATDEPYRETLTLQAGRHSGSENRPFRLVGNGAVLDGSRPVPPDAWKHVEGDVYRFQPPRMHHQLLYLDGKPAERKPVTARGVRPELESLEWCLYDRHVYFRVEPTRMPRQYDLAYAALPVGITLYEVRNVVVSDLVIQGFQLDGINAHDGVFGAELVGLTCRGNARRGISVGGASRVNIAACLVGDNGAAQVRVEGYSRTEIVDCDLLENTAPPLVRAPTATVRTPSD